MVTNLNLIDSWKENNIEGDNERKKAQFFITKRYHPELKEQPFPKNKILQKVNITGGNGSQFIGGFSFNSMSTQLPWKKHGFSWRDNVKKGFCYMNYIKLVKHLVATLHQ